MDEISIIYKVIASNLSLLSCQNVRRMTRAALKQPIIGRQSRNTRCQIYQAYLFSRLRSVCLSRFPCRFDSNRPRMLLFCFREQHCNLSGMPKLLVFMAQNVTRIFIRADFADGRRKITYL